MNQKAVAAKQSQKLEKFINDDYKKINEGQLLIITHNHMLYNVFSDIYYFYDLFKFTKINNKIKLFRKKIKMVQSQVKQIMLSPLAILVEGITDKLFYSKLLSKNLEYNYIFIPCGGKHNVLTIILFCIVNRINNVYGIIDEINRKIPYSDIKKINNNHYNTQNNINNFIKKKKLFGLFEYDNENYWQIKNNENNYILTTQFAQLFNRLIVLQFTSVGIYEFDENLNFNIEKEFNDDEKITKIEIENFGSVWNLPEYKKNYIYKDIYWDQHINKINIETMNRSDSYFSNVQNIYEILKSILNYYY